MELRQLQCLVTCAQTHSFSKAASILFTSQSNVSKTIASLEKELGKKLFERKQHGIELTEKGRQIYKHALSMMECSAKILDCADEEDTEELRVSFQPSSWFASAFCDYYIQFGETKKRYYMISAPVDEIIRRISNAQDQLGFAYIEETQLEKLQEIFQTNHIGYYVLKRTRTVLYCGKKRDETLSEIPLIQGSKDSYSGISLWKSRPVNEETNLKLKVVISTNSDYIMREILQRTELSNISPEYLSHNEKSLCSDVEHLEGDEQTVRFICIFRNDRILEKLPKQFLSFIKQYINAK
ncbi:MAG: LysR family transcriptional regulator [Lachnospiraceae bacterium]|nr:LysR family transcriptional regulator [Lachnospiraceae bacterium]